MHPFILDIRTREEYMSGHLQRAILVDTLLPPLSFSDIEKLKTNLLSTVHGLPMGYPIRVYCKKGIRSGEAAKILRKWGFTNVIDLGGVETNPLLKKLAIY